MTDINIQIVSLSLMIIWFLVGIIVGRFTLRNKVCKVTECLQRDKEDYERHN